MDVAGVSPGSDRDPVANMTRGELGAFVQNILARQGPSRNAIYEAVTATRVLKVKDKIELTPQAKAYILAGSGGSGTVTSVSSGDTSLVVTNPTTTPSLQIATMDVLFTNRPPALAVPFNGKKGTGVANGTAATDIAAFGQIPTALPPNGAAGGDHSGTYPNPAVKAITETSGPTSLVAGTITDGQFLKRVGSTLVSALAPVTGVFGRTGAVVAASGDYLASQITNAADKIATSIQSFAAGVVSTHATQGNGYATGAGGTVTQITSKTTTVILNKVCGQIITFSAAQVNGNGNAVTFTVTNSAVAATDTINVSIASCTTNPGASYFVWVTAVAAGSFKITVQNATSASLTDSQTINFTVTKGVTA